MSTLREKYKDLIERYQDTISDLDQRYWTTKDPNFATMRDHNIKLLTELKEYILEEEAKARGGSE